MKIASKHLPKLALLFLSMLFATTVVGQTADSASQALDSKVRAEITPFQGKVYLFAKNLDTGQTYSFNGDSGILPELSDGLRLTFQDCVRLMMTLSDNTATNMVLDYLSTDAVNERMDSLGFKGTRIMRRVGSGGESKAGKEADNKRFGLGSTTPHEMVQILEKLDRGEIVNKEASKEMIDLMKREQARYAIGRTIPDVSMASKYGALDALRSCVAILYTKQGKIAMAITVDDMPKPYWSVDNPGYLLMSRLSLILMDSLSASAKDKEAK